MLVVLVLAFVAVVGRLAIVQGFSAGPYAAMGLSQRIHTVELPADRGSVFDRNGNELAMSVPQSTVWADPLLVTAPAKEAQALAPVLGQDENAILNRLTQPGQFSYIDRTVPDSVARAVAALKLPGINLLDEPKRFYPDGDLAAPVIGQVGIDDQGLSGLEVQYDSRLAGHAGKLVSEDDPNGRPIPGGFQRLTPATKGSDLVLTIDRSLQYEVEQDLTTEIAASKAKGGMAIVMNRKTGEILAMASLVNGPDGSGVVPATSNLVTDSVYEPGSVQKLVTVSAALQDGVIQPDTVLTVPDRVRVAGSTFSDDNPHAVEHWTPTDVLTASSNVGALTIASRLTKSQLVSFIRGFGEGTKTDLNFPFESAGLLLDPSKWSGTTDATVAFGQGISVTAMQMAAAYNAIANGGLYVAPKLVQATIGPSGAVLATPASSTHRVVSPLVAREMTAMLTEVTRGGTGTAAAIDGYQVAGKTGTAKLVGQSGYQAGAYYASFAGFVPATDPAFTAMVVLNQPSTIYGGTAAAPVFHDIATYALRELHIPPPAVMPSLFDGVPHAQPSAATAAVVPGVQVGPVDTTTPSGLVSPPPPATAPTTTTTVAAAGAAATATLGTTTTLAAAGGSTERPRGAGSVGTTIPPAAARAP
jgi:cell division protein FtsI (penicillin-binding protein 3)